MLEEHRVRVRAPALAALIGLALVACGRFSFTRLDAGSQIDVDAGSIDAGHDAGRDAGTPDAGCPAVSSDPCVSIPALASAPVIDGVLEDCLGLRVITPAGWTDATSPNTITAR